MSATLSTVSLLAMLVAAPALAEPMFNRIASFPTVANMAEGEDRGRETSAEIMTVTEDGNTLIYSDSPLGVIGLIDITDPRAPKPLGNVAMDGEPTTTVVLGGKAFVGVNTSESFANPSGTLRTVDLATKAVEASCDLGGQPDSVALAPDGSFVAVAVENERDEEVSDGAPPQAPAGYVVKLPIREGAVDCAARQDIAMTGLAEVAAEDPEPEYLSINEAGEIAVTLQENNHIAVIGPDGTVARHFSAGTVDLKAIDAEDDGRIAPDAGLSAVPREPDAVAWLGSDRLIAANEGDWKGGSRGFTVWSRDGEVVFDSGNLLEHELMRLGHYPEGRSGKKGGEPEAVITATYEDMPMAFVASERGSVVFVFDMTDPAAPRLLQTLPSGIGPEGLVAIPQRNLFAVANETDLGEDGAARAHVTLFELGEAASAYPMIVSDGGDGIITWGALSGLAVDPAAPGTLRAVSDSAYAADPAIFTIDTSTTPARITAKTVVTRGSAPARNLDLEGIAPDGEGGFWLASEGNTEKDVPHLVLRVDGKGAIQQEFALPGALAEHEKRFGYEGIAVIDGRVWLAVQREWGDDPEGQVKLLSLDTETSDWGAVRYPIEKGEGWVGLSEMAVHGDHLYLIERNNLIGEAARLKQITRVNLAELKPAPLGDELPLVAKEVVRGLIPDLKAGGGYVLDKVEGLAIAEDGTAWVVTDNDGVDDSSGETRFWSFAIDR